MISILYFFSVLLPTLGSSCDDSPPDDNDDCDDERYSMTVTLYRCKFKYECYLKDEK